MSTVRSSNRLEWTAPRSIWTAAVQLLYSLIAQLPFYYYLREIVELIEKDYQWIVITVPISTGILLFFMQVLLDEFYWNQEKVYRNRDITVAAAKSALLVYALFYFLFFYLMEYVLSSTDFYKENGPNEPVQKMMFDLGVSLAIILFLTLFLKEMQKRMT